MRARQRNEWWPVHLRYYPYANYGWKHFSYLYYVYEDGRYEHELAIGKFSLYFGVPVRAM